MLQRSHPTSFACMLAKLPSCNYDIPHNERLQGIKALQETMTQDLLAERLASLPPTPPEVYDALQTRKQFRVVRVVYAPGPEDVPKNYPSDVLVVTFQKRAPGMLYFPKSLPIEGRNAGYLFARVLELHQGWLYSYFVFSDEDATVITGSLKLYEQLLHIWQPAVGCPWFLPYSSSHPGLVLPAMHLDVMMIGYHREAAEVLHPWNLDGDHLCGWTSSINQVFETNIAYRNHYLCFRQVVVNNPTHRSYPRSDCHITFPRAMIAIHQRLHPHMKHCVMSNFNMTFFHYVAVGGRERMKLTHYHLMDGPYATVPQRGCPRFELNRLNPDCCTIDRARGFFGDPARRRTNRSSSIRVRTGAS